MRSFEFARKRINGGIVQDLDENGRVKEVKAYPHAQIPEYQTKFSAGADFFCAEEVVVPSIWKHVFELIASTTKEHITRLFAPMEEPKIEPETKSFNPTLVHTGIKASMEGDEVLEIYNRSSNPKKLGLILANSVGVIDADYYNNEANDGEIMFAFYNVKPWDVTLKVGDRVGQGVFKKILRPTKGLIIKDSTRAGGFGSTDEKVI